MMRWIRRPDRRGANAALPPLEPLAAPDEGVPVTRDWAAVAATLNDALAEQPESAAAWVQSGHARKESGDPAGAEVAYRRAIGLQPDVADSHLQLGHALKMLGRRDEAVAAYADAARLDASLAAAQIELIALGARGALPAADHAPSKKWSAISATARALAEGAAASHVALAGSPYPIEAYDRFRRDIPIRPPPGKLPACAAGELTVLVNASVAAPFLIRATLRSLQEQSVRDWRAIVVGPETLGDHPVGAFAETDSRITFVAECGVSSAVAAHVVLLDAGTILDPEALAWLVFAARRTDAAAVFADHDDGIVDPALGLVRADPWLPGAIDVIALSERAAPAVIIATPTLIDRVRERVGIEEMRNIAMLEALGYGSVPHVARLLATRLHLPIVARHGRDSDDDATPGRFGPVPAVPRTESVPPERPDRIAVVIPTRDGAALLGRAIDSLKRTARDPDRIDILVIDNRSSDDETRRLLDRLAAGGTARIIPFDAPFNWSRASNVGAGASDAPIVLFANNDIELTSERWDDALLDQLADPAVGAVGARLLYPGGTIQHAGMAFGFGPGGAEHEGRDHAADDPGPNRRFVTTHAVAAVTGAFLGVRRSDFDAIDGFDAGVLMIGHSDVDLCLRLRERGLVIRYCAQIEALHHEGATRGRNETRAAIAWDEGERADLIARWGRELGEDPSINPYWTRGGQPFDGLSEPSMRDILRHIDRTARADPWRPIRGSAQEEAAWRPEALI